MNTCTHHLFRKGSIININCHYQSSYLNSSTSNLESSDDLYIAKKRTYTIPCTKTDAVRFLIHDLGYLLQFWFFCAYTLTFTQSSTLYSYKGQHVRIIVNAVCMYVHITNIHKIGSERGGGDCAIIKEVNDQTHGCWGQAGTGMALLCEPTYQWKCGKHQILCSYL